MKIAAFETATEWCSVALWLDGDVRAVEARAGQRHGELVLPMLESLLAEARLASADLDAVAFGAGPGSFTGLRIACGIAQGLAFARNLPACGVSSLAALAEEGGAARIVACLDARMGEVYYSALEKQGARWREVVAAQCVPPAQAPRPPGEGWTGCGSGFAAHGAALARLGLVAVHAEIHPSAAAVARLAAPRLAAGEGVDAARIAPVYLRDKVALTTEERRNR
ncbi:MAG: tRNA (adenosine(37)-N6)-threonylcarbamoyltransferase complex dimerization subunit type 1 TsaB [Betaproteobacteria bacterium]|nr:tRNA (adenosine(37)-N6)-threonylcarbamoyltransferase complex dimerization subunit type 1 TsaB [Betaproteobacteria bacterium]